MATLALPVNASHASHKIFNTEDAFHVILKLTAKTMVTLDSHVYHQLKHVVAFQQLTVQLAKYVCRTCVQVAQVILTIVHQALTA